jgi:hypothetical protein
MAPAALITEFVLGTMVKLSVGLDVLHDDGNLSVLGMRDCVPDGQVIRWKMEAVGTSQRVVLGKRVS